MQTWPSHHRAPNPSAKSGKRSQKFVARNYPVLDHGAVGAATLVQRNGRFEWVSLASGKSSRRRYISTQPLDIFPATKSPPIPEPKTTINQRADHGAHFLRTYFPDVDISSGVIRSQITEDTLQAAELAKFDPFEGNILDIVDDKDRTKYLAFPTGELSAELNLTPVAEGSGKVVIRPSAIPSRTFSTPIQQITSSPSLVSTDATRRDALVGARTFGATYLLRLDPEATSMGYVYDVTNFTSQDVGNTSIVDVKVSPLLLPFEALLANKKGGVWGCSLAGGRKTMVKLYSGPDPTPASPFWRIRSRARPTECMLLSGKALHQLDFRSNDVSTLFNEHSTAFITSSEDYAQDDLIRVCTTSEIIWLDPRYPRKPLLGYKHHRQFDRTLHTTTCFTDNSPLTFLSSKRNGMLTVYNVSRQEDDLLRVNDSPYGILLKEGYRRSFGQALIPHERGAFTVLRTDERAKVDCFQLQVTDDDENEPACTLHVDESDALKELRKKAENMKTNADVFGDQEKVLTNLYPAYDRIFREHMEQQEKLEEEQAEEFYDTLDRLALFWQANDTPSDHMLTSYDIAFRTNEDSAKSSRSDFTTGCLINSTRGFRAVSRDKFPVEQLRKEAPWHMNIASIQNRIDPSLDLSRDGRQLAEGLRTYDLIVDDDRTALSMRRENNAREQLAVDLSLSTDVYSWSRFATPREVGNDLATMTEALSLGGDDEPPEVEFGYLAPGVKGKDKKNNYYDRDHEREEEEKDHSGDKLSMPMGVRLLLKDWEIGTKVADYIFEDPYNMAGETASRRTIHPALSRYRQATTMPGMSQVINSQRPPTILSSQTLAPASQPTKQPPMAVKSQVPPLRPTGMFGTQISQQFGMGISQSQASESSQQTEHYMASTQVLPGPHGGRPQMPKKKPAKKRMGGF